MVTVYAYFVMERGIVYTWIQDMQWAAVVMGYVHFIIVPSDEKWSLFRLQQQIVFFRLIPESWFYISWVASKM